MTVCVSCRLYLLRDALENLISRETEGRGRCKNFPTHRRFFRLVVFHPRETLVFEPEKSLVYNKNLEHTKYLLGMISLTPIH